MNTMLSYTRLARRKPRNKVARIHARIANGRRDFTHQLTTKLIRENQVVSLESLSVKNRGRHPTLAKATHDAHWGELVRQLADKADWYGRTVVKIDRFV